MIHIRCSSSLLWLIVAGCWAAGPFYCYQCTHCTHDAIDMKPCPSTAVGCLTMRTHRDRVVRDCYIPERLPKGCTIFNRANQTCTFCNEFPGCNKQRAELLVCRSCDWTRSGRCKVERVCRVPFLTESPRCYVLFNYPLGFHFGCLDEMSETIEMHMKRDLYRVTYSWCDSNHCNAEAATFWPHWMELLAPFRICDVCYRDQCGPKVCPLNHIYSHFCMKSSTSDAAGCMSDISSKELKVLMDTEEIFICASDNCNLSDQEHMNVLYNCLQEVGGKKVVDPVYSPRDACVLYLDPVTNASVPLGRNLKNPCLDARHCHLCRWDRCNQELAESQQRRISCYNTTGPPNYIRKGQTDAMETCKNPGDVCGFRINKINLSVVRGCVPGSATPGTFEKHCTERLCNNQVGGILCFSCRPTDPNCVFSQHLGPFETCPPFHAGCFTRTFHNGSVERGCATNASDIPAEGATTTYCDGFQLCNGESTRRHACHLLHLNSLLEPLTEFPDVIWRKPTVNEWAFEACADVQGLPACYTQVGFRRMRFGCTSELAIYGLVAHRRGSLLEGFNLCDGHYCNALPELRRQVKGRRRGHEEDYG